MKKYLTVLAIRAFSFYVYDALREQHLSKVGAVTVFDVMFASDHEDHV